MSETSPVSRPRTERRSRCQLEPFVAAARLRTSRASRVLRVRRNQVAPRRLARRHRQHREAAIQVCGLSRSAVHAGLSLRGFVSPGIEPRGDSARRRDAAACAYSRKCAAAGSSRAGIRRRVSSSPRTSRLGGPWAARRVPVRRTRRAGPAAIVHTVPENGYARPRSRKCVPESCVDASLRS